MSITFASMSVSSLLFITEVSKAKGKPQRKAAAGSNGSTGASILVYPRGYQHHVPGSRTKPGILSQSTVAQTLPTANQIKWLFRLSDCQYYRAPEFNQSHRPPPPLFRLGPADAPRTFDSAILASRQRSDTIALKEFNPIPGGIVQNFRPCNISSASALINDDQKGLQVTPLNEAIHSTGS
jgi:hypothetical protein